MKKKKSCRGRVYMENRVYVGRGQRDLTLKTINTNTWRVISERKWLHANWIEGLNGLRKN